MLPNFRVVDHAPKAHEPNRHTLVAELSEAGTGDEVIIGVPGTFRAPRSRGRSHVRMEAKRQAST